MFVLIAMWGAAATAWNLIGGYAGGLSLGHAAFFGIGAYTAACSTRPRYLAVAGALAGGVVAMLSALVIGLITIRLRGPFSPWRRSRSPAILGIVATNCPLTHGSRA